MKFCRVAIGYETSDHNCKAMRWYCSDSHICLPFCPLTGWCNTIAWTCDCATLFWLFITFLSEEGGEWLYIQRLIKSIDVSYVRSHVLRGLHIDLWRKSLLKYSTSTYAKLKFSMTQQYYMRYYYLFRTATNNKGCNKPSFYAAILQFLSICVTVNLRSINSGCTSPDLIFGAI